MKEIKWRCTSWTTDHWRHETRVKHDDALNAAKSYIGVEAIFQYNDWFGDSSTVRIKIVDVAVDQYGYITITLRSSSSIAEHYFPTVSQVLNNHFGVNKRGDEAYYRSFSFVFPTGYQQVR